MNRCKCNYTCMQFTHTHIYMNVHSCAYVYVHVKVVKYDYVNIQCVNI